jgi:hypothetical protein
MTKEQASNPVERGREEGIQKRETPQEVTIRILSARNRALLVENERLGAELYRVKVERNSLMYLLQSAPHQLVTTVKKWFGGGALGRSLRKVARRLTGKVSG